MMNILITGGYGFIGSNLVNYLLKKKKYKIFVIDNFSSNKISKKIPKIKFFKTNILRVNKINQLKKKIDIVIHLAASAEILIKTEQEEKYFEDNISGLQEVLNFCVRNNVKKFIFASSASVYGDTGNKRISEKFRLQPKHYYGYTKYIGEEIIRSYLKINNINYTILRFFNIFGPKSNAAVGTFLAQKLQNKKITIFGNGKQMRDFLYVEDLCEAIYKILKSKSKRLQNKIYNLASGRPTSIKEICNLISEDKNKIIYLPKRNDDIEKSIANIKKISRDIRWRPKTSIRNGITLILKKDVLRLNKIRLLPSNKLSLLIKNFNKKI